MVWMVRMAPSAEVSLAYLWALLNLGSAMVMMIRMIAITISNSIREKPRRRRCRFIIRSLPYHLMTLRGRQAWRLLRDPNRTRCPSCFAGLRSHWDWWGGPGPPHHFHDCRKD